MKNRRHAECRRCGNCSSIAVFLFLRFAVLRFATEHRSTIEAPDLLRFNRLAAISAWARFFSTETSLERRSTAVTAEAQFEFATRSLDDLRTNPGFTSRSSGASIPRSHNSQPSAPMAALSVQNFSPAGQFTKLLAKKGIGRDTAPHE